MVSESWLRMTLTTRRGLWGRYRTGWNRTCTRMAKMRALDTRNRNAEVQTGVVRRRCRIDR